MKSLLAVRSFTHDPQGVLTAVRQFALVIVKLYLNIGVWIRKARFELDIAALTHADGGGRGLLYDPQLALRHDCSLAHWAGRT